MLPCGNETLVVQLLQASGLGVSGHQAINFQANSTPRLHTAYSGRALSALEDQGSTRSHRLGTLHARAVLIFTVSYFSSRVSKFTFYSPDLSLLLSLYSPVRGCILLTDLDLSALFPVLTIACLHTTRLLQ
jgi:hypothetical protein